MIILNRKNDYRDFIRKYSVIVDGEEITKIKSGEIKELDIKPGKHKIQLEIDWCKSNALDIDYDQGEEIELKCGNSMKGLRVLLAIIYITLLKDKYLWIRK